MSTSPLLIHIGYHKTATTWLQRALFVPEFGYHPLMSHDEVFELISRPHDLVFDPAAAQDWIAQKSAATPENCTPVISSEILSGNMFFGGRESASLAHRLHKIAPKARILVTIRAQERILPSVYMQYLLRGGTLPAEKFFSGKAALGYTPFDPAHFEYHRLVGLYQTLFGADNVLVSTQEKLAKDRPGALEDIANFAGLTFNAQTGVPTTKAQGVSYPEYAAGVLRRINHVQTGPVQTSLEHAPNSPPGRLYKSVGGLINRSPFHNSLKSRKPVTAYVARQFDGAYRESNQMLKDLIKHPIDLSAYTS